jgi:hypothetical protein
MMQSINVQNPKVHSITLKVLCAKSSFIMSDKQNIPELKCQMLEALLLRCLYTSQYSTLPFFPTE